MRALRVRLPGGPAPLDPPAARYVVETLCTLAGLACRIAPADDPGPPDIVYGEAPVAGCRLFVRMAPAAAASADVPQRAVHRPQATFLVYDGAVSAGDEVTDQDGTRIVPFDIFLAAFNLLTGRQDRCVPRDRLDNHDVRQAFLYREGLLHVPLVNQYAALLTETFAVTHQATSPWPAGKTFALALSHDVDYPVMIRWIETARQAVGAGRRLRPAVLASIVRGRETFWQFDRWRALEARADVRSAFYFCGRKGSLVRYLSGTPDPFYDVSQPPFPDLLRALADGGWEVGMHAGFHAHRSTDALREEKARVERALGAPIAGNRHHYWHMNPENPAETAGRLAEAGFEYDTSIAFERRAGFRYGVAAPFQPFDPERGAVAQLWELPPTLMDDQLFGYASLAPAGDPAAELEGLVDAVRACGGVFVADFHARVLNETFFPGWAAAYERLLDRCLADSECYCTTPREIARRWREHAARLVEPADS